MRRFRIAVFERESSPTDGGSHTLLSSLQNQLSIGFSDSSVELVPIPWSVWSYRRRPFRRLCGKLARSLGAEMPVVDLRSLCRHERIDAAYFTAPILARIDVPFVFTLWDMGHRTIPEFPEMRCARDSWMHREAVCRRMLGQASFTIVGNRAGAAEVCSFYCLEPSRVVPIPFPNPDFAGIAEQRPQWLPVRPFFLYPAQTWPHKNHVVLLRALRRLANEGRPAIDLVFVGSDKGNNTFLRQQAADLGIFDQVRFAGFVSPGELKALYLAATGLSFPSLLGPNNLPPQEAAVLGCPMILSNLLGHREQMGEGALYADACDVEGWSTAMLRLATDAKLRSLLAAQARESVKNYTTENYVIQLAKIFERLITWRSLWGQ